MKDKYHSELKESLKNWVGDSLSYKKPGRRTLKLTLKIVFLRVKWIKSTLRGVVMLLKVEGPQVAKIIFDPFNLTKWGPNPTFTTVYAKNRRGPAPPAHSKTTPLHLKQGVGWQSPLAL